MPPPRASRYDSKECFPFFFFFSSRHRQKSHFFPLFKAFFASVGEACQKPFPPSPTRGGGGITNYSPFFLFFFFLGSGFAKLTLSPFFPPPPLGKSHRDLLSPPLSPPQGPGSHRRCAQLEVRTALFPLFFSVRDCVSLFFPPQTSQGAGDKKPGPPFFPFFLLKNWGGLPFPLWLGNVNSQPPSSRHLPPFSLPPWCCRVDKQLPFPPPPK